MLARLSTFPLRGKGQISFACCSSLHKPSEETYRRFCPEWKVAITYLIVFHCISLNWLIDLKGSSRVLFISSIHPIVWCFYSLLSKYLMHSEYGTHTEQVSSSKLHKHQMNI